MNFKAFLRGVSVAMLALTMACSAYAQALSLTRNENAIGQLIAGNVLADIYKHAGLVAHIQPFSGVRSTAMALSGEMDGEAARIYAYGEKHPELVRVEPAFYYLTTGVFAKEGKDISVKTKDDLKKYRVGIVRGIAHAELATQGLVGVTVVGSYDQLYKVLDADRIDVAIDEGINAPGTNRRLGLSGIKQIAEIARLDLFNMLNPGKKYLAPKISTAIKQMKASGELDQLVKKHEKEALQN